MFRLRCLLLATLFLGQALSQDNDSQSKAKAPTASKQESLPDSANLKQQQQPPTLLQEQLIKSSLLDTEHALDSAAEYFGDKNEEAFEDIAGLSDLSDSFTYSNAEEEEGGEENTSPGLIDKRYAPRFVGKRYAPRFVGKRYAPRFVGKRYAPRFVGKRYAPRFVGKRYAPRFVGKRYAPRFVGKRYAPRFVGKRYAPRFVGKRYAPRFVGKRYAPYFVGKRFVPHFVGRKRAADDKTEEVVSSLEDKPTEADVERSGDGVYEDLSSGHFLPPGTDKRGVPHFVGKRFVPHFVGKKRSAEQTNVEAVAHSKEKRSVPRFVGKREIDDIMTSLSPEDGSDDDIFSDSVYSPDQAMYGGSGRVGKRGVPRFVGKRQAPRFVGKRGVPRFVGKRYAPRFVGKRYAPRFVGRKREAGQTSDDAASLPKQRRGPPRFVGKRDIDDLLSSLNPLDSDSEEIYKGNDLSQALQAEVDEDLYASMNPAESSHEEFYDENDVPLSLQGPAFVNVGPWGPQYTDKRDVPLFVGKRPVVRREPPRFVGKRGTFAFSPVYSYPESSDSKLTYKRSWPYSKREELDDIAKILQERTEEEIQALLTNWSRDLAIKELRRSSKRYGGPVTPGQMGKRSPGLQGKESGYKFISS